MRIIFLNIWGRRKLDEISNFISTQAKDTDIFCLQEVHEGMVDVLAQLLPEFSYNFKEIKKTPDEEYAQATFVKKTFTSLSHEILLLDDMDKGLAQYTQIDIGGKILHLCNVHGVARPGKRDNPARILQSEKIIDFMAQKEGIKIVGGDLNVSPDTMSNQIFLEHGYSELIKDFNIKTTRNHFAWDRYPDTPLYYSDYVFVNKEVPVKNFSVLDVEISDHLPIILEF